MTPIETEVALDQDAPERDLVITTRTARIAVVVGGLLLAFAALSATRATTMLVGGAALALLLSLPLARLQRVMPRRFAIPVLLLSVLLLIVLVLFFLLPALAVQISGLVVDVPAMGRELNQRLTGLFNELASRGLAPADTEAMMQRFQSDSISRLGSIAGDIASRGLVGVQMVAGMFIGVLGALFIAIYLLVDAPNMRARLVGSTPEHYRADVGDLWDAAAQQLSRYFASMVVVAIIQAVVASAFLSALGVPYAIVLGTWIGATSTIPYIGTWFGGIPAIAVASLQSPARGLTVFVLFFLSTTVIGNAITPRIQGAAVNVHPVLVLLTVIAAGEWFGLLGMFLAVPALAIGRVLFDFLRLRVRVAT